jgi:hypothetical protein
LCAAQGGLVFEPSDLTITRGTPGAFPSVTDDRWRVYLTGLQADEYSEAFGGGWGGGDITVVWDTSKAPIQVTVETTEVRTDGGDSLMEEDGDGMYYVRNDDAISAGSDTRSHQESLSYRVPPAEAKSLSLRGTVHIDYEMARDVISFERPAEQIGRPITRGDLQVSIISLKASEATINIVAPSDEDGNLRGTPRIEIIGSDDGRYSLNVNSTSSSGFDNRMDMTQTGRFTLPSGVTLKRIDVVRVTETHRVSIPFDFKDVKIR